MNQYYEQNVINNNIDERKKRTRTLNFIQTACIIIAVFALLTSILMFNQDHILMWLGILALIEIPFICGAIIIGYINKRNNTEYDYVVDDEFLKISAVYYRSRRKLKYNIRLRTVISVGLFDSEGYKKIEGTAQKKQIALVNYDDEDKIVYILYSTEKGRRILFIEPDRGFIIALKRIVNAVTVFDKSINDFQKKLDEEGAE